MSTLLLVLAALCAAIAAMPDALRGVGAIAEPVVAAQGTLLKYAGGPFNTAFISARLGAPHWQMQVQMSCGRPRCCPSLWNGHSLTPYPPHQHRALFALEAMQGGTGSMRELGRSSFTSRGGTWFSWVG